MKKIPIQTLEPSIRARTQNIRCAAKDDDAAAALAKVSHLLIRSEFFTWMAFFVSIKISVASTLFWDGSSSSLGTYFVRLNAAQNNAILHVVKWMQMTFLKMRKDRRVTPKTTPPWHHHNNLFIFNSFRLYCSRRPLHTHTQRTAP